MIKIDKKIIENKVMFKTTCDQNDEVIGFLSDKAQAKNYKKTKLDNTIGLIISGEFTQKIVTIESGEKKTYLQKLYPGDFQNKMHKDLDLNKVDSLVGVKFVCDSDAGETVCVMHTDITSDVLIPRKIVDVAAGKKLNQLKQGFCAIVVGKKSVKIENEIFNLQFIHAKTKNLDIEAIEDTSFVIFEV